MALCDIPEHCDILVALKEVCQAAAIPQVEKKAQILSFQAVTAEYISDLRSQHARWQGHKEQITCAATGCNMQYGTSGRTDCNHRLVSPQTMEVVKRDMDHKL